jgi:hypothetical protein
VFSIFSSENRVVYGNVEKRGGAGEATNDCIRRCMRFSCWINKATDIQTQYVILLAVPWQRWLRERACVTLYVLQPVLLICTPKFVTGVGVWVCGIPV